MPVEDEPAPRDAELVRGQGSGAGGRGPSAEEGLPAGPVADDEEGVLVQRVAGDVEEAGAARGRALPDPPAAR